MEKLDTEKLWYEVTKRAMIMMHPLPLVLCKFCNSPDVVKNGIRGGTQYWLCRECNRGFVDNKALPKMKYPLEVIASGIYQYYIGSSLNEISGHIDQHYKLKPSSSAIYNWVTRFSKIAVDKAEEFTPKVGNTWIADETMLKIAKENKHYWLIDIIDAETRFLLATRLTTNRDRKNIALLLRKAYLRTGKVAPKKILTDGWKAYPDAVDLVFGAETKHIVSTPFVEKDSTNLIERFQGTLKDRTKVMRSLKTPESARRILDGWLIYYNFFRPHDSLNDKTPAQVAKIKFPYQNWLDIVKSQSPSSKSIINLLPTSSLKPVRQPYIKRPYKVIHKTNKLTKAHPTLKGIRR